ncbi:hypothetical protein EDB84DRAFT_647926 [Lactarius hengduanensis]|nr:hypothetical protein EDB84DRAFT_647926 [Lactarius hengduanensis]
MLAQLDRKGHENRHDRRIGRQRGQLIGFIVVGHQRINGTSFVFSAAVPVLLAVSASEGIDILRNMPSILNTLQENVRATRAVLDCVEAITNPSRTASPIIHIHLRYAPTRSASTSRSRRTLRPLRRAMHRRSTWWVRSACYRIVDEAPAQGLWTTRTRRLRGNELVEARPSTRLAVTAALSRKECERAADVIKAVVVKADEAQMSAPATDG